MAQQKQHGGKRKGAGRKRAVKVETLSALVSCGYCGNSALIDKVANGQEVLCQQCGQVGIMPARATVTHIAEEDSRELVLPAPKPVLKPVSRQEAIKILKYNGIQVRKVAKNHHGYAIGRYYMDGVMVDSEYLIKSATSIKQHNLK